MTANREVFFYKIREEIENVLGVEMKRYNMKDFVGSFIYNISSITSYHG